MPDYAEVASVAKSHKWARSIAVANHFDVEEVVAMEYIRTAQEKGYDVGMPRDYRDVDDTEKRH